MRQRFEEQSLNGIFNGIGYLLLVFVQLLLVFFAYLQLSGNDGTSGNVRHPLARNALEPA